MKIFSVVQTNTDNDLKAIAAQYTLGGEMALVSVAIEYNKKCFREIQFVRRNILGKPGKKAKGIVFVDENNQVIEDKRLQKELFSAFFNLEQLFDEGFLNSLTRTTVTETDLEREEKEAEFVAAVLSDLHDQGVEGADRVKEIICKLPQMKREGNQAITAFLDSVSRFGLNQQKAISYDDIICRVKPLYLETLMKNFEKIKMISSGSAFYDSLRKEAMKSYRKRLVGMMGSNTSREGAIIDGMFTHLSKVIEVYEEVLGRSNSEYIKYLNDNEKKLINEKIDKNRVK